MSEHTKGPWRWGGEDNDLTSESGEFVLYGEWHNDQTAGVFIPREEDARLIAAAPEMLEALKLAAKEFGWHGHGEKDRDIFYCENCAESHEAWDEITHRADCPIAKIKAAIRKAEGE